jgi:NAD(P)-dependent dehydrogenase (short-subunit alcohol dehydrogenase family)
LTEKLARQGLNVVMVALEDAMLKDTHALLSNKYPSESRRAGPLCARRLTACADVQLRKVGADLSRPGYLEVIARATSDIEPTLIFNNAGFVMTGLFADTPLEKLLANYECNATAPLNITHHFLNRMLDKKLRGEMATRRRTWRGAHPDARLSLRARALRLRGLHVFASGLPAGSDGVSLWQHQGVPHRAGRIDRARSAARRH